MRKRVAGRFISPTTKRPKNQTRINCYDQMLVWQAVYELDSGSALKCIHAVYVKVSAAPPSHSTDRTPTKVPILYSSIS